MGDRRREKGDGRQEMGNGRCETGDGRQETGDGRMKKIDRRGFSAVISKKFSAYSLGVNLSFFKERLSLIENIN